MNICKLEKINGTVKKFTAYRLYCFLSLFFISYGVFTLYGYEGMTKKESLSIRKEIESLDLYSEENLNFLENLLGNDAIITGFKIRQRLLSLPYQELKDINEKISSLHSLVKLRDISMRCLEQTDYFVQTVDIFLGLKPPAIQPPFTEDMRGKTNSIESICPYAEHLYFYNPVLRSIPDGLVGKKDNRWIKRGYKSGKKKIPGRYDDKDISVKKSYDPFFLWERKYENSRLSNFIVTGPRQTIGFYEDRTINATVRGGVLLTRNDYRIHCLDIGSGSELWDFALDEKHTREYYQTYRAPHQRSSGSPVLMEGDFIYSELSGKLIALQQMEDRAPELKWEKDLGEFTLCAEPVLLNGMIVVLMINPRGELWACGHRSSKGDNVWSRYLGISSYSRPASNLSVKSGERLYIATNHGAVICLSPVKGEIIWIRRYESKTLDLYKYWRSGKFRNMMKTENFSEYDSQFLELADDGDIYYKPRESESLYMLDPDTGELLEEIMIDTDRYTVIRANDEGLCLIEKGKYGNAQRLIVTDIESERILFEQVLSSGGLRGVMIKSSYETIFKLGSKLYSLKMKGGLIGLDSSELQSAGWLLGASGDYLILGNREILRCFGMTAESFSGSRSAQEKFEDAIREVNEGLKYAVMQPPSHQGCIKLMSIIKKGLESHYLELNDIVSLIEINKETFADPGWAKLFRDLEKGYGDRIVEYNGVNLKFSMYLVGTKLIKENTTYSKGKQRRISGSSADLNIRCNNSYLLRTMDIKENRLPDFFLILNHDQLLCIHEGGKILWDSYLFFNPANTICPLGIKKENMRRKRMLSTKPSAVLIGNTIIMNDGVNLVALNRYDGSYRWSMSCGNDVFDKAKTWPPENMDDLYKKYGVDREYLSSINICSEFLNGRLIACQNNVIYSIDPESGFCSVLRKLTGINYVSYMKVKKGKIYIYSLEDHSLYEINEDLDIMRKIQVNPDPPSLEDIDPNIIFSRDHFIFQFPKKLIIIQQDNINNRYVLTESCGYETSKIIMQDDRMIIINDEKIKKFKLYTADEDGYKSPEQLMDVILSTETIRADSYYCEENMIILPKLTGETFVFEKMDLETGKMASFSEKFKVYPDAREDPVVGILYMDFFGKVGDVLYFMIVSLHGKENRFRHLVTKEIICGINIDSGAVEFRRDFPEMQGVYYVSYSGNIHMGLPQFLETRNSIIYGYAGRMIYSRKKP